MVITDKLKWSWACQMYIFFILLFSVIYYYEIFVQKLNWFYKRYMLLELK